MNLLMHSLRLCLYVGFLLIPIVSFAQDDEQEYMYFVLLDVKDKKNIPNSYKEEFHKKHVKIEYAFEDTINYLSDFIYEEEAMEGPDCFVPEIKLVFRYYTYVVSLYCTSAIKYKNASAFKTSSQRMQNDLVFTPTVYEYLNGLKYRHFGNEGDGELVKSVVIGEPLEVPKQNIDDVEGFDLFDVDEGDLGNDDGDLEEMMDDEDEEYKLMFDETTKPDDEDLDIDLMDDDDDLDP